MSDAEAKQNQPEPAPKRPWLGDGVDAWLSGMVLGALLVAVFATWAFAANYLPSIDDAHTSVVYADETSDFALATRALIWFSHAVVFVGAFALILMRFWRRSFATGMRSRWVTMVATLAAFVAWSFFWQLLPMDQSAWHGTLARKGVIEATPELGNQIANWVFPAGTITQATLSWFATMALAVFPALMLVLALLIWRTRAVSKTTLMWLAGIFALGAIFAAAAGLPQVATLESSVRPEFSDVRPEWFFLPLSKALALSGAEGMPSFLQGLVAGLPGLLIAIGLIWPFVGGRWQWQFDRIGVALVALAAAGLLGLGLYQDYEASEGYFAKGDLDAIMLDLGDINEKLGPEDQINLDKV
ncbi:MAG: cytochrome b N-terminal domain-containing protein, partial [Planctomycetes bacterium]|nr:cytochrome b N-terminal domain-containing protein [Planctomycetota bacterium]